MVYDHTTTQREQWSQLDPHVPSSTPGPAGPWGRARMGRYTSDRLPESLLEQIWGWMNDLGILVPMVGRLSPGEAGADGIAYTLNVSNGAIRNKGLTAENVTVALTVPPGARVIVANHYPVFFPPPHRYAASHDLINQPEVEAWLRAHPVRLYLHGHVHHNWVEQVDGQFGPITAVNSASSTQRPRRADASAYHRIVLEGPAFRVEPQQFE